MSLRSRLNCYSCGTTGPKDINGRNCRLTRCIGAECFAELTQPYVVVDGESRPPPCLERFDKERCSKPGCGRSYHQPCLGRAVEMAHLPRVLYYKRDKATGRQIPSGWTEVRTRLQHLLCEHCLATACPGEVVLAPVESEDQQRAKRARLDEKHASKLRKRLQAGLDKLDQLGSAFVGHAVSRHGRVSLFRTPEAAAMQAQDPNLATAQAEMGKQLKACVTASRAGAPLPPEQEGLEAGVPVVPADLAVAPLDLQAAAVAEALAHAEAMAHAQVQAQAQQARSPRCCRCGCLTNMAVLAQQEAPPAEEAPPEGVAAVLVEAAANAAEARSPAAAAPTHAVAPPPAGPGPAVVSG